MLVPAIEVRNTRGRYPHGRAVFRSENIEANVIPLGGSLYALQLGDSEHDDMWLELTVEINPDAHIEEGNPC